MTKENVLYRDQNCIIVNKRLGEAVEGASGGMVDLRAETARYIAGPTVLAEEGAVLPNVAVVHRLDVPVSGCVVFALNENATQVLNAAFAETRVRKLYWAIVEAPAECDDAPLSTTRWELNHYLEFDSKSNKSKAWTEKGPGRRRATLFYTIIGKGDRYRFLEIELVTGRHHQIRAQLAAAGLHIKGDLKYGSRRSEKGGGIRLHCRALSIPNPADPKKRIEALAPVPEADALWQAFEAAYQA